MNYRHVKILIFLFFLASRLGYAQEIRVATIRKLVPDVTGEFSVSGISPNGKQLLITRPNSNGLYLMDLKTSKTRMLSSSPGAGYEPAFSADNRYVTFRTKNYAGKKRESSMNRTDLATGTTVVLEKDDGNIARPVTQGNLKDTFLLSGELTPMLSVNGEKRVLKPGGDGTYIWASLSPDKTRMLYYLAGQGTGICDLDGRILASTSNLSAPKWLTNGIVVGMDDRDDGHRIISSEIVAWIVAADKKINLTSTGKRHELYPHPFTDGRMIAFTTSNGELFLMKVKVN